MKTETLQISRVFTISVLVLLSGWVLIAKQHGLREPLERDLTTCAYIAHNLIGGDELYSVWI